MKQIVETQLYRDAGAVKRFHTQRTHRSQSLAEHTFNVMMLLKRTAALPPDRMCILYEAALHHDLPELFTGDIPAPVKRSSMELAQSLSDLESDLHPLYRNNDDLTEYEAALLCWADRAELVLWCLEELRMGNTFVIPMVSRALGWIRASAKPHGTEVLTAEIFANAETLSVYPDNYSDLEKYA